MAAWSLPRQVAGNDENARLRMIEHELEFALAKRSSSAGLAIGADPRARDRGGQELPAFGSWTDTTSPSPTPSARSDGGDARGGVGELPKAQACGFAIAAP
jgi:hypothetical protein